MRPASFFVSGLLALSLTSCNSTPEKPTTPPDTSVASQAGMASPSDCELPRPVPCAASSCAVDSCAEKEVQAHRICADTFEHMRSPDMTDTRSYPSDELEGLLAGTDCSKNYVEITDDLDFVVHTRKVDTPNKGFMTAFYNLPLFTQLMKDHPDSMVFYKVRRRDTPENPINAIFKVWKAGDVTGYFDLSGRYPPPFTPTP